ncbi:MAG: hypothetical protein COA65_09730 [Rhodospirillaceae bacterium]|nr:MAG: hypothetical protein COA65_09730 [Rhodospirillaceae bacterium]
MKNHTATKEQAEEAFRHQTGKPYSKSAADFTRVDIHEMPEDYPDDCRYFVGTKIESLEFMPK